MSGTVPPPIAGMPLPPTGPGDCSQPAQDWRRWMLGQLMMKMYTGVESLSDRGRSVNYASLGDLGTLIRSLQGQIALCDNVPGGVGTTGALGRGRRMFYAPYSKWL